MVRDNGPGVVADKVPILFKRRFTTKRHGHGIGLITCRRIVENHGGEIDYRFDGGAVFTVMLPLEQPHHESGQAAGEHTTQAQPESVAVESCGPCES